MGLLACLLAYQLIKSASHISKQGHTSLGEAHLISLPGHVNHVIQSKGTIVYEP